MAVSAPPSPAGDWQWFWTLPGTQIWRGLVGAVTHQPDGKWCGVWSGPEEAVLVLGPPRSGKTSMVVVPNLWMAPAAAVSTSTKPDVLEATFDCRRRMGTCYVFDPTGSTPIPEGAVALRWSPLVGCEVWDGAVSTARAIVRAARPGARAHPESLHWNDRAEALLAPVLHAAARAGRTMAEACGWVASHDVREPESILRAADARLAKVSLSSVWRTEERERSGIFSTAAGLLSVYRSEAALATSGEPNFDPELFAASRDTLYICAPGYAQDELAPLVVALLEQIRDACYRRRRQHPDSAPTVFLLDEVANIAPLPGLPQLVSEGGGQGVVTLACLQDLSQARARWGAEAEGFFSLFRTKVIFPGLADGRTLELVSQLLGEEQVVVRSVSQPVKGPLAQRLIVAWASRHHGMPDWRPTVTESIVWRRRLPVEHVYQGRPGCVLMMVPGGAWDHKRLEPYWQLRDTEESHNRWRARQMDTAIPAIGWPPSQWATPGPRVLQRRVEHALVVVPGTGLPPARQQAVGMPAATGGRDGSIGAAEVEQVHGDHGGSGDGRESRRVPDLHGYRALVRVIGPPQLAGVEIAERDKAVEMACALAMHHHRPMTNEELRGALWPGELGEPGVTAKSLRNVASTLRKAMGAELFPEARAGTGYQFDSKVGCDYVVFCRLAESATGEEEFGQLRRALSLVRGAPFEGVKPGTYTWAWTEHVVSQIERSIRTVAYRFCELGLEAGDHESATWGALQALMADPYDRKLWELYLTASAGSGRRALEQAWKEAKGVLLEDSQDLTRLVDRLRANSK